MKVSFLKAFGLVAILVAMNACNGGTDVVESGTYDGVITEVEADKSEIYVQTAEGKTLELYFTDETTLKRMGEPVKFAELEEGQNVKVEVEKVGKRMDPVSVVILE